MFKYELSIFVFKFKNDLLHVNLKCCFKIMDKVHKHLTFFYNNIFPLKCSSKHGHKYLAYQVSKL